MLPAEAAALQRADAVYGFLDDFKVHATGGRQEQAGFALQMALQLARDGIPEIAGVLAAQGQAAEGLDLTQRPMRVLCAIGVTQPHSDAANSQANTSELPVPSVP